MILMFLYLNHLHNLTYNKSGLNSGAVTRLDRLNAMTTRQVNEKLTNDWMNIHRGSEGKRINNWIRLWDFFRWTSVPDSPIRGPVGGWVDACGAWEPSLLFISHWKRHNPFQKYIQRHCHCGKILKLNSCSETFRSRRSSSGPKHRRP